MERAAALARLYESVNTIPEDIQQCLLQVAQYGCDPDQVKRWYVLVREHFGAHGPSPTENVYVEAECNTTPPASGDVLVTQPNGYPMSRETSGGQSSTNAIQTTASIQRLSQKEWQNPQPPCTPPKPQGSVSWPSPCINRQRSDSAVDPHLIAEFSTITTEMPSILAGPNCFVSSPAAVLGSETSVSPSYSETGSMPTVGAPMDFHPITSPHFDLTMDGAVMPSLSNLKEENTSPGSRHSPIATSPPGTMAPPAPRHTPPFIVTTPSARAPKRRRPAKKSVREMMALHRERFPHAHQAPLLPKSRAQENRPQPPAQLTPISGPEQYFLHGALGHGLHYVPPLDTTPVHSVPEVPVHPLGQSFSPPREELQLQTNSAMPMYQGSQSAPLPQQQFGMGDYSEPYYFPSEQATSAM